MRTAQAFLATLLLAGCQGVPAPMVVREQLALEGPVGGVVRISGRPGTILGSGITSVILAVRRDVEPIPAPAPGRYTLQHFGAGTLITTAYADIGPDGSLPERWLGRPDLQLRPDDELEIILTSGVTPVGFALTLPLAWRP